MRPIRGRWPAWRSRSANAGASRLAILCAEQLAGKSPAGTMIAAPAALQRLAYPIPFATLIEEEAIKRGLDPRLIAAVIRQESRFETGAISTAAAQGLMQIIPATADWIALQLGWPGFKPAQIYRPYVNVAFGVFYLQQQALAFDGSLFAALAAYNAGPGNAAVWRKLAPADDDLMAALIDIGETRIYVQTVWVQYMTYRRLYPH